MLQLRPNCEHCNKPLPPDAKDALICSFECTFCRECVDSILGNACPNCGGNFERRPIRPSQDWVRGNCLANHPASTEPVHKPVDEVQHRELLVRLDGAPAYRR